MFVIYYCSTSKKKKTFLESWDKTGQDRHAFVRIFWTSRFDLTWPSLTWHWPLLGPRLKMNATIKSNSASQMAHKSCVARHSCNIFLWWSYLTWPWPWPLLSTRPILTCYLCHPLWGLLVRFGFATVISPVFVTNKEKSDDFKLSPDPDPSCDLLKIF